MPAEVLDASALGALIFVEAGADSVAAVTAGADLLAPPLLLFEVASICRKKCLARPEHRERYLSIVSRVSNMGIQYLEVDQVDTTVLALDLGLTTYDAAYLWLALEHQASLVTLDGDFAKAAARVLPPHRLLPRKH